MFTIYKSTYKTTNISKARENVIVDGVFRVLESHRPDDGGGVIKIGPEGNELNIRMVEKF